MRIQLQIMIGLVVFGMISCTGLNTGFTKKKYLRIGSLNPVSDNNESACIPSTQQYEIVPDDTALPDFSADESETGMETIVPVEISEQEEIISRDELSEGNFLMKLQETSDEIKRTPENGQFEKQQTGVNDPETEKRKPDNLDKLYYAFVAILIAMFLCLAFAVVGFWGLLIVFWGLLIAEFIVSIAIAVLASTLGKAVPSKEASKRKQTGLFVGVVGAMLCAVLAILGALFVITG